MGINGGEVVTEDRSWWEEEVDWQLGSEGGAVLSDGFNNNNTGCKSHDWHIRIVSERLP